MPSSSVLKANAVGEDMGFSLHSVEKIIVHRSYCLENAVVWLVLEKLI